jgi:hypothetical protein
MRLKGIFSCFLTFYATLQMMPRDAHVAFECALEEFMPCVKHQFGAVIALLMCILI